MLKNPTTDDTHDTDRTDKAEPEFDLISVVSVISRICAEVFQKLCKFSILARSPRKEGTVQKRLKQGVMPEPGRAWELALQR
jgi:hypothetical protein